MVSKRARRLAATTTNSYATVMTGYLVGSYALLIGHIDEAAENLDIALAASGTTDPDSAPEHVPLVLLPMVAGMVAAMRGDARTATDHTYRRAPAWLSQRSEVDPTASSALAFNRALVQALLDDPPAVVDALHNVNHTDEHGFVGHQEASCDLLLGWARARLGDPDGVEQSFAGLERVDQGQERVLRACLRSFVADACLAFDDPRAIALLDEAQREAEARGEVWWLSEILRLKAVANHRLGDGELASKLLDEAQQVATAHGARLIQSRIAATRLD